MSNITTKNNLTQNYTKGEAAFDARIQLLSNINGVLSTVMRDTLDLEGYPFGSVVPFCISQNNEIVVLISDLAQHTKNINENPKVSLTIHNDDQDNIQKGWRLTLVGDATKASVVEAQILAERYERYFPESHKYHKVHDFNFYLIKPKKARYINGFGEIHWVNVDTIANPSIFDPATEADMITHMNEDHHDALILFLNTRMTVKKPDQVRITQIDQYGFTIAHDEAIQRFFFDEEATSPNDIRLFLVDMVKKVRAA